jgi:hypothetical protein
MNLYYFDPNTYGEEFFTIAESEEEAIKALNNYLQEVEYPRQGWGNETPALYWGHEFFKNYVIRKYNRGEVVNSEIC